jgi:[NiFe] hydrogenase diaphorase moiety large subunit
MNRTKTVFKTCELYGNNQRRMLDILWDVQNHFGWISPQDMQDIAERTGTVRVEVEGVATFYAFFKTEPQGKFIIHLCEDIIDRHAGMEAILSAFEQELKIKVGETSSDGLFSLHLAPCMGMSDQSPAALINETVVTDLTASKVRQIIRTLKKTKDTKALVKQCGDGNNAHQLVNAMVKNNIRVSGQALLNQDDPNKGLIKALSLARMEVLDSIDNSHLKGRGGAGFITSQKWRYAAAIKTERRYVICNADEGEPGTFKDRVLLTERAHLVIAGMTIVAFATNSEHGILYLRAEYRYLLPYLESVLAERRQQGLLGEGILIDETEHQRFNFDIRIQLGAGAYICGEESALINSCEGKRGEPRSKPPFPTEVGYLGYPTIVNNTETFANVPLILDHGPEWFRQLGTEHSSGTKLLCVSGDCEKPGVYELPMGVSVQEVLDMAGALNPEAVQVGGASGVMIARNEFQRRLCFEDLPTAGALMVFSRTRSILDIANYFMHFFIEESCGYCTPCRVGNVFLKKGLEKIINGEGEASDLDYLENLSTTIIQTSRCGLGHTSPNPILSTIKNFPLVYAALLKEHGDGRQAGFNIQKALDKSRIIAKRRSIIYDPDFSSAQWKPPHE